jgi:hypothetical protein
MYGHHTHINVTASLEPLLLALLIPAKPPHSQTTTPSVSSTAMHSVWHSQSTINQKAELGALLNQPATGCSVSDGLPTAEASHHIAHRPHTVLGTLQSKCLCYLAGNSQVTWFVQRFLEGVCKNDMQPLDNTSTYFVGAAAMPMTCHTQC